VSISSKTADDISNLLIKTVLGKLKKYKPETYYMPFQYRLLGKDRYALFSFIHSMNTTFGMSIWEQVAVILARGAGNYAQRQYKIIGEIDNDTEAMVRHILQKLRRGEITPDKAREIEQIKRSIKAGSEKIDPDSIADLFVKMNNKENYFDITSAKPNMKEFVAMKQKLLRWTALRLSRDKRIKVFTRIAIPYNPYHPEPYERWTLKGLYDLGNGEILVGEEFWNFVACDDIYEELLDVFLEVGEKLRGDIDKKFAEFRGLNDDQI
jgi:anti-sigma28 factor (negative regulator of flagellin synthesis)